MINFRNIYLVACALGCVLFSGCGDNTDVTYTPIELDTYETEVATEVHSFGIDFFKDCYNYNLNQDNQKVGNLPEGYNPLKPEASAQLLHRTNTLVSPLSASMVIGMLANALSPADQSELLGSLDIGGRSINSLNSLNSKLLSSLPKLDKKSKISLYNSTWLNNGVTPSAAYSQTLNGTYSSDINSVDLNSSNGKSEINSWIKDKTGSQFNSLPYEMNSNYKDEALWLNTLSFNGEWKYQFNPSSTSKENFLTATNLFIKVDMMRSQQIEVETSYYPEGVMAVRMPYGNGAYSMTAIRAYYDHTSIDSIVNIMSGDMLNKMHSHFSKQEVSVRMPKWKNESSINLLEVLGHRIPSKFITDEEGKACDWPELGLSDKKITSLYQSIKVETNEEGSKVEVVSQGSGGGLQAPPVDSFVFDRPFIYIISENSTGSIVAIGSILEL